MVILVCNPVVFAISAQNAVTIDGETGQVWYSKNPDSKSLIASTTKIMTGLLVCESGELDQEVTIPTQAVGVEGSSMYLKAGEVWTVEQLLYGMMLKSGNDAATALAIAIAGSESDFVEIMNQKAEALGLLGTHFGNPHGLDSAENYGTAMDLAKLASYALKNPVFRQVCSTKSKAVGQQVLQNHNKMLWRYDGCIGVKTGYTKEAGRILVSSAERNGRTLVAVTINAPDDWNDHQVLLDNGFDKYTEEFSVEQGQVLAQQSIVGGLVDRVACVAETDGTWALLPGEQVEIIPCVSQFAYAPILCGRKAGIAKITVDGQVIGTVNLVYETFVGQETRKDIDNGTKITEGFIGLWRRITS